MSKDPNSLKKNLTVRVDDGMRDKIRKIKDKMDCSSEAEAIRKSIFLASNLLKFIDKDGCINLLHSIKNDNPEKIRILP